MLSIELGELRKWILDKLSNNPSYEFGDSNTGNVFLVIEIFYDQDLCTDAVRIYEDNELFTFTKHDIEKYSTIA